MPRHDRDEILSHMTGRWVSFYETFGQLHAAGGQWRGPCPLHDGTGPNFSIDPETGHWFCHSACQEGGDVFEFLKRRLNMTFSEALDYLADYAGLPPAETAPLSKQNAPRPAKRIAAVYSYVGEDGEVLHETIRYEPKSFAQRRPDGNGGHVWGLPERRVLYRLPEVLAAVDKGRAVYVCEGEKDADALAERGLTATTAPMGAGKWHDDYTATLRGAGVILLPDNDQPGRDHALKVAAALFGEAKRVRIVELPGLPEKGDVSDWLAAGGTREALAELVKNTPDWKPPFPAVSEPNAAVQEPTGATAEETALRPPAIPKTVIPARKSIAQRVISARQVGPPPTDLPLLYGPYFNIGATHWLTGSTGLGKSTFAYNVCGALAAGAELWGIPAVKSRVLYLDMESGDVGRSLKLDRLYMGTEPPEDWLFATEPVRFPEELADFLDFVKQEGVTFVVFDTARRCFSVKDENDNAETYNRVVPTLDALKAAGVGTLVMGHPAKNGNGSARGAGAQEDAGDVNLTLSMHSGEVGDRDGIIKLSITKNRLLGLGHEPLYLRRVGNDHFERVEASEAGCGTPGNGRPPSKVEECQEALILRFQQASGERLLHADMKAAMAEIGYKKWVFDNALRLLRDAGGVIADGDGAWLLRDPFSAED